MNEIIDGEKVNTFLDTAGKIILLCGPHIPDQLVSQLGHPQIGSTMKRGKIKI